jgi:hypothetical protein
MIHLISKATLVCRHCHGRFKNESRSARYCPEAACQAERERVYRARIERNNAAWRKRQR